MNKARAAQQELATIGRQLRVPELVSILASGLCGMALAVSAFCHSQIPLRRVANVENKDLLLTIAEVAVAFAGFASIVSVLGQRSSNTPEHINALRMRAMILSSLLAVAFSILPFLLHSYGLAGDMLWRTSSAVLLLASAGLAYSILSRIFAVPASETRRTWIGVVVFAMLASTILTAGANALGATGTGAAAVYLTSIGLLLFLAGFSFSFILLSFLAPIPTES